MQTAAKKRPRTWLQASPPASLDGVDHVRNSVDERGGGGCRLVGGGWGCFGVVALSRLILLGHASVDTSTYRITQLVNAEADGSSPVHAQKGWRLA
jgi:hypothetical protein